MKYKDYIKNVNLQVKEIQFSLSSTEWRIEIYTYEKVFSHLESTETKVIADNISRAPIVDINVNPSPKIMYEIPTATTTCVNRMIVEVTEETCFSPARKK